MASKKVKVVLIGGSGYAGLEAVRWLLSLGHRRIGIITGPCQQWSAVRRWNGYLAAMRAAGIDPPPEWRHSGDYTWRSGRSGAAELMAVRPRVTAIVCGNDAVALSAMQALQDSGVRIPEDVSLIGFDDINAARWSRPQLATVRQPLHEIGGKAAETLIQEIATGKREAVARLYPGELIRRPSVGTPGRGNLSDRTERRIGHPRVAAPALPPAAVREPHDGASRGE